MRNFYKSWGLMKFEEEFINTCNQHDLLVVGGGNFLELCWDYSKTGTTFDISIDNLKKIKVPILFNAIGVDDGKGTNENNLNKFNVFLEYVLNSPKILFSVRNDGSKKILKKYFDDELIENKVHTIPDCGFFFEGKTKKKKDISNERINIGINIGGDMSEIRYSDEEEFIKKFAKLINKLLLDNDLIDITFFPHMFLDFNIISKLLINIDDEYRRKRISVEGLLNGSVNGAEDTFGTYTDMDLILGMRFHSNVCSIGQNIPNIGMISYHKHGYLFDELNLEDRKLNVNDDMFFEELYSKIVYDLKNLDNIKSLYSDLNEELNFISNEFYKKCKVTLNL